ncbi:MAG: C40 family peptidase [Bacteroidales bacterium]|nr:C40 family peptidase [Bacteroidales bacterium]
MKRFRPAILAFLLLLPSCGSPRRAARNMQTAPAIPPLVDSADIRASRQRALEIMDSIELARVKGPEKENLDPRKEDEGRPAATTSLVDQLLEYAHTFIGTPYRLGASGPEQFDCSGFTSYVFRAYGYELPHSSAAQFKQCRPVEDFIDLQKGDLVFFGARNSIRNIGHVGIVVDIDERRGMFHFIHASTSHGVEVQRSTQPYFMMRYIGAGRILPDNI